MADDEDPVALAAKLPLPDRVTHKVWKVREAAYRELADKFNTAVEECKLYPDFAPLLPKIIRDANAAAQLVGLEAVVIFADRAPPNLVRKVAPEAAKAIVDKALTGRPSNKQKAAEAVVMFVGADAGDAVCETFATLGFSHTSPKVIATAVDIVREAVVTYGAGAVPLKPIASAVTRLFTHSNEPVRKAAKALVVELHRWIGDPVRAVVKDAPEVTIKELQSAFDEHAGMAKPVAQKLTRAMEQRVRNAPEGMNADGAEDAVASGDVDDDDELDLSEEVDLLAALNKMKFEVDEGVMKDWFVAVESKKWNVRKDALNAALEAIGTARLTPLPLGDVLARLRKILAKDANVNVVAHAAKLVGSIAAGLRKNFPPSAAKALTVDLFSRLKDKNRLVTDAVSNALDVLHGRRCIHIHEFGEEIATAAESKVPKVRSELFRWLDRCFRVGTSAAHFKGAALKTFGTVLVAGTEDSTPEVRDAAVGAIASLQVLVGERSMLPFFEKLDKLRMDKIATAVKEVPAPKPPASSATVKSNHQLSSKSAAVKTNAVGTGPGRKPSQVTSTQTVSKAIKPAGKSGAPSKILLNAESDDEGEIRITADDALQRAVILFDGFDQETWAGKSVKARAESAALISESIKGLSSVSDEMASIVLGLLTIVPGLADANFLALKAKLELLGLVAQKSEHPLARKSLKFVLEQAVEKLGDIKCAIIASDIFMQIAEATSARYLFEIVSQAALRANDARAKLGITKFALSMVKDFGLPAIPPELALKFVVQLLDEPPPQLRNTAISLAAELSVRVNGDAVLEALVATVDTKTMDIFKRESSKLTSDAEKPTRTKRCFGEVSSSSPKISNVRTMSKTRTELDPAKVSWSQGVLDADGMAIGLADDKDPNFGHDQRVRVDISHHFAPGSPVLQSLKSTNWKTRQDSLVTIDEIVVNTGSYIDGDVGPELVPALRARLGDSNRNLAVLAYTVTGHLVHAMGPGALPHAKSIVPIVLSSGCVDIKKNVRDSAMMCLDLWFQALGMSPLLQYLGTPLASLNPGFRKDYLEWLVPRLRGEIGSYSSSGDDLSHLIEPCLACMRDRTVEVRQLAELMLDSVVANVGFMAVDSKVLALSKAARLQLEPFLGKYRGGNSCGAQFSAPSRPLSRIPPRERPRSMASPRTPAAAQQHLMDVGEVSTPRSGLRRARPASMRPPTSLLGETPSTPVRVTVTGSEAARVRPILRPGSGRDSRGQRVALRKALVRKEGDDAKDKIAGVEEFVPEKAEDIAADLRECVPEALLTTMIAPANRFQFHVESIDELTRLMREEPDTLVQCSDVLLRWSAFRIDDIRTPPTVLAKAGEFISSICEIMLSSGSSFRDYEAAAVIPVLVDKCGSNRNVVREAMLAALLSVGDVVDDGKLIAYLVQSAWNTGVVRSKLEIMSALPQIIDRLYMSRGHLPAGVLVVIARLACGLDESVGRSAAVCIDRVHQHVGDNVWEMIGELSEDDADLLERRFALIAGPSNTPLDEPASPRVGMPTGASDRPASTPPSAVRSAGPLQLASPVPSFPAVGIRPEDFRLSVAPAPPSNVMSAIGDSLAMRTPVRAARPPGEDQLGVEATPALPVRRGRPRGNFSFISSHQTSHVQAVVDLLESDVREEQMQGLDTLFADFNEPNNALLKERAGDLFPLVTRGFRDCVERLHNGSSSPLDPMLLKKFLNAVMAYVRVHDVVVNMERHSLEQLLNDVLDVMIPDDIPAVQDWDRVRRGVNLAVLKVLESCDRNVLFSALFNLLVAHQQVELDDDVDGSPKSQLLIKSVAKVAKRGFDGLDLDELMRDLHLFVESVTNDTGSTNILNHEGEPLQLVRTVVDALLEKSGQLVYEHLSLVPCHEKSALVQYIHNVLPVPRRISGIAESKGTVTVQQASLPREGIDGFSSSSIGEDPPVVKLSNIVHDLQSTGGDDGGLRRLRAFMLCYPEVDIKQHIAECPKVLRDYVNEGLKRIISEDAEVHVRQVEKEKYVPTPSSTSNSSGNGADSASQDPSESAGQAYLKRLREIQVKYGLPDRSSANSGWTGGENSQREAGTRETTSSQGLADEQGTTRQTIDKRAATGEKENGLAEHLPVLSVSETRDKATALRERMARIRKASAD